MERDFDLLLKLYALIGGPLVVDALVDMSSIDCGKPVTTKDMNGFWRCDGDDSVRRKAAIAARCVPLNPHTQLLIMEAHRHMIEIERDTDAGTDAHALIVNAVQATLETLPFRVAGQDERMPRLLEY